MILLKMSLLVLFFLSSYAISQDNTYDEVFKDMSAGMNAEEKAKLKTILDQQKQQADAIAGLSKEDQEKKIQEMQERQLADQAQALKNLSPEEQKKKQLEAEDLLEKMMKNSQKKAP